MSSTNTATATPTAKAADSSLKRAKAKTTYVATAPNGAEFTRTSATRGYTHALLVADEGGDNWGVWSWHQTRQAGSKALQAQGVHNPGPGTQRKLVPVKVAKRSRKDSGAEAIDAQQAPRGKAPRPASGGQLAWNEKDGVHTARGGDRMYRVAQGDGGAWFASQRGFNGTYTPVAGLCTTIAQAQELAQRYENGERHLSHRGYRDLPYKEAVAKLEQ
ncbi:hypothetical protein ABGB19_03345 [Mycobacterium sp. B14F4]|uniref:hypothetical protein n=1 Tax=Mycobacterium sp. B14F4 TaxID=3153565 RepID=UPI00325CAD51